jgi:preprotein translocase subunit SecG
MYGILSIILVSFILPQQTKYFGGLAISLKQAGFFSKYKTAESFVYLASWLLIGAFFRFSFVLAKTLS